MRVAPAVIASALAALGVSSAAEPPGRGSGEKDRTAQEAKLRTAEPRTPGEMARKAANERLVAQLSKAEQMELFRIDPLNTTPVAPPTSFRGYDVLAHVRVEKADQRAALVASLGQELHWDEGLRGACFRPRHGLRAVVGKDVLELVVCFECNQVEVYRNGVRADGMPLVGRVWDSAEKLLSAGGKAKTP